MLGLQPSSLGIPGSFNCPGFQMPSHPNCLLPSSLLLRFWNLRFGLLVQLELGMLPPMNLDFFFFHLSYFFFKVFLDFFFFLCSNKGVIVCTWWSEDDLQVVGSLHLWVSNIKLGSSGLVTERLSPLRSPFPPNPWYSTCWASTPPVNHAFCPCPFQSLNNFVSVGCCAGGGWWGWCSLRN